MPTDQHEHQQQQEWIVVTKNKNKHKGSVKNKTIHNRGTQNMFSAQSQQELSHKFLTSKAFQFNQQIIQQSIQKLMATSNLNQFHCECLGLGNFLTNKKSFIQLQFFQHILLTKIKKILLKDEKIEIVEKAQRPLLTNEQLSINMYDPAFSQPQINQTKQKEYSFNQKFEIKQGKINVFFMPHCERFLYEAVYQQYQKVVDKNSTPLLVIGNSIVEYKQRCTLIKEKIPDIFLKIKVTEQKIFDYENALNDTFILL